MPKITVEGTDFNTEDMSDHAKAQLASLQFLEVELQNLKREISVYQEAKRSYIQALKAELDQKH